MRTSTKEIAPAGNGGINNNGNGNYNSTSEETRAKNAARMRMEKARQQLMGGQCGKVQMYYDHKAGSFFIINSDDETIFTKETGAKRMIYDTFGVSAKEAGVLMYDVKNVYRIFNPAAPKIRYKGGNEPAYLNMFAPSKYMIIANKTADNKRIEGMDWDKYPAVRLLMGNVFGDDEKAVMYFVNWLSAIINTRKKMKTAIVLKGVQGTGKGVLFDYVIAKAVGQKHCITVSNEELRSDFNDCFENKIFIAFNEVKADFNERSTIYERLKAYITDDKIIINGKYRQAVQQQQHFNCIVFSNHEIPLQIEMSDRRYSVFETSLHKLPEVVAREHDPDMTMSEWIKNLKEESDIFLEDVARYKYDIRIAMTAYQTSAKQRIQEITTTAIVKLISRMKEKNIEWLREELIPLIEQEKNKIEKDIIEEKLEKFLEEVQTNKYTQETLKWLYQLYIGTEINERKIWQTWTAYIGHTYATNGIRYRSFERTK